MKFKHQNFKLIYKYTQWYSYLLNGHTSNFSFKNTKGKVPIIHLTHNSNGE